MKKAKIPMLSLKRLLLIYCFFVFVTLATFIFISVRSIQQTEQTMIDSAEAQLNNLNSRLDTSLQSVQFSAASILYNDELSRYSHLKEPSLADRTQAINELHKTIGASQIMGSVVLYLNKQQQMLSSNTQGDEKQNELTEKISKITKPGWYRIDGVSFYYINFSPFQSGIFHSQEHDFLVAGKLRQDYIYSLLEDGSSSRNSNLFFSFADGQTIALNEIPEAIQTATATWQKGKALNQSSALRVARDKFHILSVKNKRTGTALTMYLDMSELSDSMLKMIFSSVVILVLLLCLAAIILDLFYVKVYKNLHMLLEYLGRAEKGNYSMRIPESADAEFNFVFQKYNDMLSQTERLLDRLKNETQLRETAEFRQLQAQINPHFLYNNLLFIMSMAETSPKAVSLMTSHLADYYRYVTKKNTGEVTLAQEIYLAENYLTIMALRKEIDFFVDYPEELAEEPFMQLIIQPIVENAIGHGIESRIGASQVNVQVVRDEQGYSIQVYDDGKGLTVVEQRQLEEMVNRDKPYKNGSVGLWNVNQRLINRYGLKSRLRFISHSPEEGYGLTVALWIPIVEKEKDDESFNRR